MKYFKYYIVLWIASEAILKCIELYNIFCSQYNRLLNVSNYDCWNIKRRMKSWWPFSKIVASHYWPTHKGSYYLLLSIKAIFQICIETNFGKTNILPFVYRYKTYLMIDKIIKKCQNILIFMKWHSLGVFRWLSIIWAIVNKCKHDWIKYFQRNTRVGEGK